MAIQRLEAQCRVTADGAVMPSVVLALMVPAATDARQLGIPLTHPSVESDLRILEVVGPALQLLLADLDLFTFDLGQRLASLLLIHILDSQCVRCNRNLSGNAVEYRIRLVKRIGADNVDWLEGPHPARKYTVEEIKAIKAEYRAKTRELKGRAA